MNDASERVRIWKRNNPEKAALSQRRQWLKYNYGLSIEAYTIMLQEQNYCCAVCKVKFDPESKAKRAHIDHNHETGEVRALICMKCNSGLGYFGDDISKLQAAVDYLRKYK